MTIELKRRRDGTVTVRSDLPETHAWPEGWVHRSAASGHVSLSQGRIVIHTDHGDDVSYRIVKTPGVYCVGCDARIGDVPARSDVLGRDAADQLTAERQAHVAACDGDGTDPENPAGYLHTAAYHTVLEEGSNG